jgi:2,3-bisphosphoglycerate-independent phosphoglycerate mutase
VSAGRIVRPPSAESPLVLVILDGWGLGEKNACNAVECANKPNMDSFLEQYPHTSLSCAGEDVGLPEGQMGNSEVGHLNMGAGRVVYQELTRISRDIKNGGFFNNPVLLEAIDHVRDGDKALHLMGLLSDGGVHSHITHLFALLELARDQGLKQIFVHAFLDGRDVPPANAGEYIDALEEKLRLMEVGAVATVMGRYYAMDRDRRWERTARAYQALARGEGLPAASAAAAVEEGYRRGETDEFLQPTVVRDAGGQPVATVREGDAIIFFNFRPDRARQLTRAFVDEEFEYFDRVAHPGVHFTCMTLYDKTIKAPVAFRPRALVNTLGEVLSYHNLRQLRLAETEKYAHVTFFFNGGVEAPNPGEDRLLIPSPRVATYDLQPEMSAVEVTNAFLEKLEEKTYHVIIVNYANPDMVGHTGVMKAAVRAVETVDSCLGRLVGAVRRAGGTVIITADHGNADKMADEEGGPHTAHTTSQAPFILVDDMLRQVGLRSGRLEDVAPTMLDIMGIGQPAEMTGQSLILRDKE